MTVKAHRNGEASSAKAKSAKASAVAKARRIAPAIPARIGSTPANSFRGDPAIFGRLVEDHDRHRALLAMILETTAASRDRRALFTELTREIKAHAAAEEQALWSTVLRKPEITDQGRHAVAEHKEIDDMFNDLATRDMASTGWLTRFRSLRDVYLHHIREEEQEQFVASERHLTDTDRRYMKRVFNRRKRAEKAMARITPKRKKAHGPD